jgi:hypothetical protein
VLEGPFILVLSGARDLIDNNHIYVALRGLEKLRFYPLGYTPAARDAVFGRLVSEEGPLHLIRT